MTKHRIELSPRAVAYRDMQEQQRAEFREHLKKINDAEWRAVLAEDLNPANPENYQ